MLKHPVMIAVVATALGATLAALGASPAVARPRIPQNMCDAIAYCLGESPTTCGMTHEQQIAANLYLVTHCGGE